MKKVDILKKYFGYDSFRHGQEKVIDSIMDSRDALCIIPTGGGKSICYQVPALLLPGVTLVISPLISLMKDQVMALKDVGIRAAYINSSLNERQISTVYNNIREGIYKIIYVAPERLEVESFISLMEEMCPSFIAVDEAHCISQWGQDFRPSYLKITGFIKRLPKPPVVGAFTATATNEVQLDIIRILELNNPVCVVSGFDRSNLYFDVLRPERKSDTLRFIVEKRRDKSGIIYCATRANVEKICSTLNDMGIPATKYHAGLSETERSKNQDDFQYDEKSVMVATNAFGMGIDKSNVSYVIHYNMPKSLEAYYQEAGRAGRDGEKAECILLFSSGDVTTAKYMIKNRGNQELSNNELKLITEQEYIRLDKMIGYVKERNCLRGYILDYFGQEHEASCGNCGCCNSSYTAADITVEAQMILSCISRVKSSLGYNVGASLITQVLMGSKTKRVLDLGLNRLSTYGLMNRFTRNQIKEYIEFLEGEGYLSTYSIYQTLELTEKSKDILFRKKSIEMKVRTAAVEEVYRGKNFRTGTSKSASSVPMLSDGESNDLFEALREVRTKLAKEENVPAYIVFSNAALTDMVQKRPRTIQEFLDVKGVGQMKADNYGQIFLDAIGRFETDKG